MSKIIRVVGKRVLVEITKGKTTTKGGLYIPDGISRKRGMGTILLLGDGLSEPLEEGMVVLFSENAGTRIGEYSIILREEDISAVLEGVSDSLVHRVMG